MLVNQAVKNPLTGMALFPRSVQIRPEHRDDSRFWARMLSWRKP